MEGCVGERQRISPAEAADLLGCSPRLVQKLLLLGSLAGARVGRNWTTTQADVDAYLQRNANSPAETICPPISTSVMGRPTGGRASRSTAATSAAAYEQLIARKRSAASRR